MNGGVRLAVGLTVLGLVGAMAGARQNTGAADAASQMDERWTTRAWGDPMDTSIDIGQRALKVDPRNYEVTWRLARAYWWSGHSADAEQVTRRQSHEAMQCAEDAIDLQPGRVEGHYFQAVATGEYATTIGVSAAIWKGVAPRIEGAALKAYELDRHYDNGGPMIILGRFYSMLPWPLQDLDKSRRYLEELRQAHPNALIGRLYLAETYYKLGQLPLAHTELIYVAHVEPGAEAALIRPPAHELAAQRLAQWFLAAAEDADTPTRDASRRVAADEQDQGR